MTTRTDQAVTLTLLVIILLIVWLAISPSARAEELATFYADAYHGNLMANGSRFSMYDPTTVAANRWPLGTWLKIRHLENGRLVYVQIRDRGAFTHAVDLSRAAFAQLDDLDRGVIPVSVEVVERPVFRASSRGGTRLAEDW